MWYTQFGWGHRERSWCSAEASQWKCIEARRPQRLPRLPPRSRTDGRTTETLIANDLGITLRNCEKRLVNCSRVSGMCRIAHDAVAPLATSTAGAIATAAAACLPGGTFARLFDHLHRRPQGPIYVVLAIVRPGAVLPCHHRYRCDITLTFSYILLDIETKFSYIGIISKIIFTSLR